MRFTINFRLSILGALILASCSSDNGNDEEPPPEVIVIGSPSGIKAFDIGNEIDASDIRVFFDAGDNRAEVEEYRIALLKSASSTEPSIEEALAIESERYFRLVSGAESPKFNFGEDVLDLDGDPIQNGVAYDILIVAIPTSEDVEAVLAQRSSAVTLSDDALQDIYISSRTTNSVELFDGVTGEHIRTFVSGNLSAPQEVIFLENGDLIVTARFNTAVNVFDGTTGNYLGAFTSGYDLNEPTKTSIGPDGHLYVSQWNATVNSIVRFNLETGEFIDEVVPSFFQGMDHDWDSDGNFYAVSWGLSELRKYDSDFQLISSTKADLSGPVNIWIDEADQLFVVDWTEGNVKIFDTDLNFVETFITGLANVEGYVFDGDELLLCDWQRNLVNVYNAETGAFKRTLISSSRIQQPNSITFGPDHKPN